MKMIQSEGLIAYLSSSPTSPAYARLTGSPFIPQRAYVVPRPVTPIPYRTSYHTNRHLKADYNRVPYRPKHTPSYSTRDAASKTPPAPPKLALPNELPGTASAATAATTPPASSNTSPQPATKPAETLPYGTPVSGRPGMVTSPYAQKHQLVDVTGLPAGDTVKDPYTGKLFRVPPTQQASAKPLTTPKEATPPSPDEAGATPKQP
ncbi:MAG: hypothetical protein LDL31_06805 [Prosthecobacter sp.]|nr:hypothetical protein [Prosthecobacter sp.]